VALWRFGRSWRGTNALPRTTFSGGAVYLVGTILLTIVYHVPRNEALAKIEPRDAGAESYWRRYLSGWTAWNHLRAAASLAAAAALTVALHV